MRCKHIASPPKWRGAGPGGTDWPGGALHPLLPSTLAASRSFLWSNSGSYRFPQNRGGHLSWLLGRQQSLTYLGACRLASRTPRRSTQRAAETSTAQLWGGSQAEGSTPLQLPTAGEKATSPDSCIFKKVSPSAPFMFFNNAW